MTAVKDEVAVKLTFDNRQFEQGVKQSTETLNKFKKSVSFEGQEKSLNALSKASKNISFEGFKSGADKVGLLGKALDSTANSADKVYKLFGTITGRLKAMTVDKIANKIKDIFVGIPKQIISGGMKRAQNIEQAQFQLKGLLKDSYDWKKISDDIDYAVSGTRYGLDAAAKVAAQLSASNLSFGDEMKSALRGISGVAAMTNSEYEDIGHIFTTIAGQGKVMTQQLNQFAGRGLNVAATLAEYYKVDEAKLREMVTKGKVDFKTFATAMNEAFGEQATKANDTFSGALSNVKASLSRMGAQFMTPGFEELRKVLVMLIPVFKDIEKLIKPVSAKFEELAKVMSTFAVDTLRDIHFDFLDMLGAKGTGFSSQVSAVQNVLDDLRKSADETLKVEAETTDVVSDKTVKKQKESVDLYQKTLDAREAIDASAKKRIEAGEDEALVLREQRISYLELDKILNEYEDSTKKSTTAGKFLTDQQRKNTDATTKATTATSAARDKYLSLYSTEMQEARLLSENTEARKTYSEIIEGSMESMADKARAASANLFGLQSGDFGSSIKIVTKALDDVKVAADDALTPDTGKKVDAVKRLTDQTEKTKQVYEAFDAAMADINKTAKELIKSGKDETVVNKEKEEAIKALKDQLAIFDKQADLSFNIQDKSNKGREITNKLYDNAKKAVSGVSDKVLKLFGIEKDEGDQISKNAKEYKGLEEIAADVILGKYGNGEERKKALEDLGLSYAIIQNKVNELLGCEKRHAVTAEDEAKMAKYLGGSLSETGEEAKKSKTTFEKLLDVLAGIGAVINIIREAGTAVVNNLIRPFLSWALPKVFDAILSALSPVGEQLVALNEKLHDSDFFNVKTKELADWFINLKDSVVEFWSKAKELQGVKDLQAAFERFKNVLSEIGGKIWGKITEGFKKVGEDSKSVFTMENFLTLLNDIAWRISDFLDFISSHKDVIVDVLRAAYNAFIFVKDAVISFFLDPVGTIKGFGKNITDVLSKARTSVVSFFKNLNTDPKAALSTMFGKLLTMLLTFKEKLLGVVNTLFGSKKDAVSDSLVNAIDVRTGAVAMFEKGKTLVSSFISGITTFFGSEGAGGKVIGVVKDFVSKLIANFNIKKGLTIGGFGVLAIIIKKVADFIGTIHKTMDSVRAIPGKLIKVLGSISDVLNGYAMNLKSDALLKVAGAIGILTLAIVALSFVDTGKVIAVGGVLAGLMAAMAAVIAAIGLYNKAKAMAKASGIAESIKGVGSAAKGAAESAGNAASKVAKDDPLAPIYQSVNGFIDGMKDALSKAAKMAGMSMFLVSLGITIAILVGCIHALLKVDWQKEGIPAALAVTGFIVLLVAAVALIGKYGNGGIKAGTGIALIGLAASLYMLIGVVKLFSMLDANTFWKGMLDIGAVLAAIAIFSNYLKPDGLLKAAASFILLQIALTLMIIPLIALSLIPSDVMAAGLLRIIECLGILVIASMAAASAGKAEGTASLAKLALALTLLVPAFLLLGLAGAVAKNGIIALAIALGIMVGAAWAVEKVGGEAFEKFAAGMETLVKAILLLGPAMLLLGASFGLLGFMISKWGPEMLTGFIAFAAGLAIIGAISTVFASGFKAISFPLVALAGLIVGVVLAIALLPNAAENLQNFFGNVSSVLSGLASGIAEIFGIATQESSSFVSALDNYKMSLDGMKFLTDDVKKELAGKFEELKHLDGSEYSIGLQNVISYIEGLDLTHDQIQKLLDTTMASLIADAQEQFTITFNQVRADVKKLHMNSTDEANLMSHVEALASTVPGEFQTKLNELEVKIGDLVKDPTVAARIYKLAVDAADAQAVYNTTVNDLKVFIANSRLTDDAQAKVQEAVDTLSAEQGENSQYTVNLANLKVWVDKNAVGLSEFQKNKLNTMLNASIKAATNANLTMETLMIAFENEGIQLDDQAKIDIQTKINEAGQLALTDSGAAETMVDNLIIDLGEKYGWSETAKTELGNLVKNAYASSRIYHSKIDHLKVYAKEIGWSDEQISAFSTILNTTFNSQTFDPLQLETVWVELKNSNMTPEEITEFYTKLGDVLNAAANKKITIDGLEAQLTAAGISEEKKQEILAEVAGLEGLTGEEYQAQMKVITDLTMEAAPNTPEGEELVQQFLTDLGIYEAQSGDYKTAVVESMVLAVKSVDWGEGEDETEAAYIEKIRGLLALDGDEIGDVIDELIVTMSKDPHIDPVVLATVQSLGEQLHNTFTSAYSTDLDELLKKEERIRRKKFLGSFVTDQDTGYTIKNQSSVAKGMKKYFKGETEVTQDLLDQFMDDLDQQLWDEKLSLEDFLASFDNMGMSDEELINFLFWQGDISKGLNPSAFRELIGPLAEAYITGASDEFKYRLTRDNPDKIDYTMFLQNQFTDDEGNVDWVGMRNYSSMLDRVIEENREWINEALNREQNEDVSIVDVLRAMYVGQGKNGALTADQLGIRELLESQDTSGVLAAFYEFYNNMKEELGENFREEDFINMFLGTGTLIAKDASETIADAFDQYYTLEPAKRAFVDGLQDLLHPGEEINPEELYAELDSIFKELGLHVQELKDGKWVDVKELTMEDILGSENPFAFLEESLSPTKLGKLTKSIKGLRAFISHSISECFETDPETNKKVWKVAKKTGKEVTDGAVEAANEGIEEGIEEAPEPSESSSSGMIESLVENLLSGGTEKGGVAESAMNTLKEGLENGDFSTDELTSILTDKLTNGQGESLDLSGLFGGIDLTGVLGEDFSVGSLVNSLVGKVKEGDLDISALQQVGGWITGGLSGGITDALGMVIDAVGGGEEGLSGTVINTLMSLLDCGSPSQKTKQIGEWLDEGLAIGLTTGKSKVIRRMMEVVKAAINVVKDRYSKFTSAGEASGTAYATGVSNQSYLARIAGEMISLATEWAIRLNLSKAEDLGEDWGKGFVKGVESQVDEARAAGRKIGEATEQGEREATQTKSPSKVAAKLGNYFGMGYVIGLEEYTKKAGQAGKALGDKTIDALRTPMMIINDILNSDMESSPVITPVLDLSNIQNGARAINGMIPSEARSLGYLSYSMGNRIQTTNADVVSAILGLSGQMESTRGDTYNINGVTYDDGSNIVDAVQTLVRAARIERRR